MSALTGINYGIKVGGGALLAGGVMYGLGITDPTSLSGMAAMVGGQAMTWLPDLARRCMNGVKEAPLVPAGAKFTSNELAKCVNREISRQLPDPKMAAVVRQAVTEVFSNAPNFMVTRVFFNEMKERAMSSVETALKTEIEQRNLSIVVSGPIRCRTMQKVSRIFDDVFNNQYQYLPLDKNGIERLSAVYLKIIDVDLKDDEQEKELFHRIDAMFGDLYPDVDVGFPLGFIETYAPLDGYIQLRPIEEQATKLIIGCGNGRLTCCGGRPNYMGHFDPSPGTDVGRSPSLRSDQSNCDYHSKYSLKHNHNPKEYVTIDATLGANPTIVGFFGNVSFEGAFNGKKFNEITFEGYFPCSITDIMKREIRGLLNKGGKVFLDNSQTKEDVTRQFLSD